MALSDVEVQLVVASRLKGGSGEAGPWCRMGVVDQGGREERMEG